MLGLFFTRAEWIGRLDELDLAVDCQPQLAYRGVQDHPRRPAEPAGRHLE